MLSHPTATHRVGSFIHEILTEAFLTGGLSAYNEYFGPFSEVLEAAALAHLAVNDEQSFEVALKFGGDSKVISLAKSLLSIRYCTRTLATSPKLEFFPENFANEIFSANDWAKDVCDSSIEASLALPLKISYAHESLKFADHVREFDEFLRDGMFDDIRNNAGGKLIQTDADLWIGTTLSDVRRLAFILHMANLVVNKDQAELAIKALIAELLLVQRQHLVYCLINGLTTG